MSTLAGPNDPASPRAGARVPPPVSGRTVLFSMLGIGLTVVLGVATFAALTRPPRTARQSSTAASASASSAPTPR